MIHAATVRLAIVAVAALLCAGCDGGWPQAGRGGMAETRAPAEAAITAPPEGLAYQLACTLGRLSVLRDATSRTGIYTGEVSLLDVTAGRAQREYAGQLYRDSGITLTKLDGRINQVAAEMELPRQPECG